jgi:hypothetical protein
MGGHGELAAGRWRGLTLAEQLAHVGSEVDRAIAAWEGHRPDRFDKALTRALELFDLTARDERWRGHRRREILRSREEFCRLFFADDTPAGAARTLSNYFLRFAVLARERPARRAAP